jgi:hypothetical protein
MDRVFHVTSVLNRDSIAAHGLDWTRMACAPGIAGSLRPEEQGCFVCMNEFEVNFFVELNNTGGAVDVWVVDGVAEDELVMPPNGFQYVPRRIPPTQLTLYRRDVREPRAPQQR